MALRCCGTSQWVRRRRKEEVKGGMTSKSLYLVEERLYFPPLESEGGWREEGEERW